MIAPIVVAGSVGMPGLKWPTLAFTFTSPAFSKLSVTGGSGSGAVSLALTGGTATDCSLDGTSITASSAGTCLVVASKAADLFFGPAVPAEAAERNWIKTLPGRGWFAYFRLYGPTQPYFDRAWVLDDIEQIE